MGLFDRFFGSGDDTIASIILKKSAEAGKVMFEEEEQSSAALFEVLLFSSGMTLNRYRDKFPTDYNKFEKDYFNALKSWAKDKGVYNKIKGSYADFVNVRFRIYLEELFAFMDDSNFLRTKTTYFFYVNPLGDETESEGYCDLFKVMEMTVRYTELSNRLRMIFDSETSRNK